MRWEPPADPRELVVEEHLGVLELRGPADRPGTGARVDLGAVAAKGFRRLPLIRCMGERVRTVADATAGLLGDAWLLALAGFQVTAFERSPMVARLVRDGLVRAANDPRVDQTILARLHFIEGDAAALLGDRSFDAILVDPMFPPKVKASALSRKDVRLLRAAVGDDLDAAHLLEAARRAARMRVCVKRADDAPDIADAPAPDVRFEGKTARFDVYLTHEVSP
ncbi:MAG: rRNA methyltransferase [Phycisphaerales bacterium]|nr:rRNA methyltransferase [Phycisphaerales bacterium]PHX78100.1 MAG: rRNA methyltransferase [Planctomycetaceae bacterium]